MISDERTNRIHEASSQGAHEQALRIAMELREDAELLHIETLYDIAREQMALGQRELAYRWLRMAVDAGFWDAARLRSDEVFAPLRNEEPFRDLVRGSWAKGYLAMLERPEREDFQQKDEVLRVLAFSPGERVADVGTGSGYFTIPVAKAVGPRGSVLAIDIVPEMLAYVAERVRVEGLDNVRLRRATREDSRIRPGSVDTILLIDTLHYVVDRAAFARRLRVGLAPGGRIVVIDYIPKSMEERPWGPSPEQQFSRATIDAEMAAAGMQLAAAHDFLSEQYIAIYRESE